MKHPDDYVGKPVRSLQTMLRVIAAEDPAIPGVVPDGIYGAQTMKSVTAFQKLHQLPPTGVTDRETWDAVRQAFSRALVETDPAEALQISLSPHETLCEGSESPYVMLVQVMLHTVAAAYGNLPDCTVCGLYDRKTANAVRAIQCAAGLPENGQLDKQLWRLLCGLYSQVTAVS